MCIRDRTEPLLFLRFNRGERDRLRGLLDLRIGDILRLFILGGEDRLLLAGGARGLEADPGALLRLFPAPLAASSPRTSLAVTS